MSEPVTYDRPVEGELPDPLQLSSGTGDGDATAFATVKATFGTFRPVAQKQVVGDHDTPSPEQDLRDAAAEGDIETLRVLLASKTKFNIDARNPKNGKTALHYAATAGKNRNEAVQMLVDAGADVTLLDNDNKTAYQLASEAAEADHDNPDGTNQKTPFILRDAATGQLKELLKNPKKEGYSGYTFDMSKINALLDAGADDGPLQTSKMSLHEVTALKNAGPIARALIKNGADLTELRSGLTPYEAVSHYAEDVTLSDGTVRKGMEKYKELKKIYEEGAKAQLQDAFKKGDWKKAENLIKLNTGIDPKARYEHAGEDNVSLLSFAAGAGQFEVVKALVEKIHDKKERANHINAKGSRGRTAMHSAADSGNRRVYDYLRSQGGKDDIKADDGNTPKKSFVPPKEPPTKDTKREEGDTRSAQEIWNDHPLLANLGNAEKEKLKKKVGDLWVDPDAAWRAVRVLEHIEHYGPGGKIDSNKDTVGNDRIDGFFKGKNGLEANPHTEAARLQDFLKHNDPDDAFAFLKDYRIEGDTTNIERLKQLAKDAPFKDGTSKDGYKKFEEFMVTLKEGAYQSLVDKANLPSNRKDILEHPEKYSAEQRGAAVLELTIALDRISGGLEHYTEYGVAHGSHLGFELHTDPTKVMGAIRDAINKLTTDEVAQWIDANEAKALQAVAGRDPEVKTYVKERTEAIRDKARGIGEALDKDGDVIDNMREYLSLATTLNMAAGENGELHVENLTIDIKDSRRFEEIAKEYNKLLENDEVLHDMIVKDKKTEDEAIKELNSRAAVFASFGFSVSNEVNDNIKHYYLKTTKEDDLKGIILKQDGSLDEDMLEQIIDKIRKDDPANAMLEDEEGKPLTNAQIIQGIRNIWDTGRGVGKIDFSLGKFWPRILDKNNPISQAYKVGTMHLFSGILAAGAMIARAADKPDTPAEIAATIGNGVQALGLSGEAWQWTFRDNTPKIERFRDKYNKYRDFRGKSQLTTDQVKAKLDNFKHFARAVTASGGTILFGSAIALGIEELKKGNEAAAAIIFAGGAANFITSPTAYTQSLAPMVRNFLGVPENVGTDPDKIARSKLKFDRFIARVGILGGRLAASVNPLTALALLGYTIYAGIKADQKQEKYFDSFAPTLEKYNITGGHDPWWDEDTGWGMS